MFHCLIRNEKQDFLFRITSSVKLISPGWMIVTILSCALGGGHLHNRFYQQSQRGKAECSVSEQAVKGICSSGKTCFKLLDLCSFITVFKKELSSGSFRI